MLVASCAIVAASAWSERLPWLYDVRVPVASQTEEERKRATRLALAQVLTRLTGTSQTPAASTIAAALAEPARYLLRYQFTSDRRQTGGGVLAPAIEAGLLLDVRFEPDAVLALLRDAQQPIWGANRPYVLVWLAVRDGRRNQIVASGPAAALTSRARQRGIATMWPLLDLRDSDISPATIWGYFWEEIEAASSRYQPDLLLVGRAARGGNGWTTDWELREPASFDAAAFAAEGNHAGVKGELLNTRLHHRAPTLAAAAEAAIDHVADTLAARYAVRGGYTRGIEAKVHGVHTVADYATLITQLKAQEYIERVDVLAATAHALDIRLRTRSHIGQLADLLGQDRRLAVRPESGRVVITWRGE